VPVEGRTCALMLSLKVDRKSRLSVSISHAIAFLTAYQ
jgi:hypothetical protein